MEIMLKELKEIKELTKNFSDMLNSELFESITNNDLSVVEIRDNAIMIRGDSNIYVVSIDRKEIWIMDRMTKYGKWSPWISGLVSFPYQQDVEIETIPGEERDVTIKVISFN